MENTFDNITFDLPKNQSNVIKVIGVGGGGSNAINHMFNQGIQGVDFIVCNTDAQALQNSPVPIKIQLGVSLTEGLGAGANPEIGQQSALESIDEIEKLLDNNTKMVFITAGMGGGTGTGAAPVIAQLAKERDILTVGIVTIPFQFEGKVRQQQASKGVDKLRKVVDSLIVINNNKLREVYGNLGLKAGFSKADEVLATASRGIAEVITKHYTQNIDLKDAKTVLSDSGTAIMGSATAEGEERAKQAIISALDSPLLNDNKISGAKNVLLLIVSGDNEITIDEIGEINDYIQTEAGHSANIIMGVGEDAQLGDAISVTIIATGFNIEQQKEIVNSSEPNKIIHVLDENQSVTADLTKTAQPKLLDPEQPLMSEKPTDSFTTGGLFGMPNLTNDTEKKTINQVEVNHQPVVTEEKNETTVKIEKIVKNDVRDIEVVDAEFIIVKPTFTPEDQLPQAVEKPTMQITQDFSHEAEVKATQDFAQQPEVNQPVEQEKIVYSLEDYMEVEQQLAQSTPKEKTPEPQEEMLNFTLRTEETNNQVVEQPTFTEEKKIIADEQEVSPIDASINDILRQRAEERKRKMKEFNYKFNNATQSLNELEKEPAYKRMGVNLRDVQDSSQVSRTSLSIDQNDDLQLRSNNSFLHDNVD
ncbi:MAG TPA: cell division protein FtsZ [Flavobacterium sp.]|nr:cell division protein FtsZ [Flavobacterium sp.]